MSGAVAVAAVVEEEKRAKHSQLFPAWATNMKAPSLPPKTNDALGDWTEPMAKLPTQQQQHHHDEWGQKTA